jgi:hypothetical protein
MLDLVESIKLMNGVMPMPPVEQKQRIIQWVTGGSYAVAVEVEAVFPIDDPSEPCLTPDTVRYLEQVADWAEAGDVDALKRVGTVYARVNEEVPS